MPQWLKDAIFYEIYPQSFYDANGDGIGDLRGITEKLDYIKDLGCNALWINPCFASPFHDAGYDISDYCTIAPRYGTNDDMKHLLREAHRRSMRVLLDLVPGHTSIDHAWFRESMKSDDSPYAGRYIWTGTPWEGFDGVANVTGMLNGICERGSAAVNFFSTQPALNYGFARPDKPWQSAADSPEALATRADIEDVMRFWLDMGCDGFRVDMAGSLVKGDEDGVETIKAWQAFRAFLDREFPEAALVSEWGQPDRALRAGFHMDFLLQFGPSHYNDLFRENPYFSGRGGDLTAFIAYYQKVSGQAGGNGLICIPSGNHDMPRMAHKLTPHEMKLGFAFLLSVPGAPFIYYGDEIGMRYLEDLPSVEGGYERTGSRSPMQWDNTLNAGFSRAIPERLYIPLDPFPDRPNVKQQLDDGNSILNEVKRLIRFRRDHAALGNDAPIEVITKGGAGEPLVYVRGAGESGVTVAINPMPKPVTVTAGQGRGVLYTIGGQPDFTADGVVLPPQSACFLGKVI